MTPPTANESDLSLREQVLQALRDMERTSEPYSGQPDESL